MTPRKKRLQKPLTVRWEHVSDPHAKEILAQIARLILDDPLVRRTFDTVPSPGLNESVPVENIKPN